MMFITKEILSEQYTKAINVINENLNERYHALFGLRLSEILFPASAYGSDEFFRDFEEINGIVSPIVIYDLNERKPVMVMGFEEIAGIDILKSAGIKCLVLNGMRDLLTSSDVCAFYD